MANTTVMILERAIVFLILHFKVSDSALAPTNLLALRVGPCENPSTLVTVSEMSLETRVHDTSMTGQMNISKDIDNGWIITGTMLKCQDIRNLDTCDHYKTIQIIKDGCTDDEDSEDQEIFSMFFHYTQPRITCPIKAGVYEIFNYPIFTEDNYFIVMETKISTSVFGYMLRIEGFDDVERLLCVEAYLKLMYIREYTEDENQSKAGDDAEGNQPRTGDEDDSVPSDDAPV